MPRSNRIASLFATDLHHRRRLQRGLRFPGQSLRRGMVAVELADLVGDQGLKAPEVAVVDAGGFEVEHGVVEIFRA